MWPPMPTVMVVLSISVHATGGDSDSCPIYSGDLGGAVQTATAENLRGPSRPVH